jgi:hypothetical protein
MSEKFMLTNSGVRFSAFNTSTYSSEFETQLLKSNPAVESIDLIVCAKEIASETE